jgi:hypothetical protein
MDIKHTKKIKLSEHTTNLIGLQSVAEGKLLLVECKPEEALLAGNKETGSFLPINRLPLLPKGHSYYKPIIISETEKFDPKEPVLCLDEIEYGWDEAYLKNGRGNGTCTSCKKILAYPEHFSPEQLQMIVDGKLKDGEKVLVECEMWNTAPMGSNYDEIFHIIKLNSYNQITLHKVKDKTYTFEDFLNYQIYNKFNAIDFQSTGCKERIEKWFEQNVK